jgi:hypothetical protein
MHYVRVGHLLNPNYRAVADHGHAKRWSAVRAEVTPADEQGYSSLDIAASGAVAVAMSWLWILCELGHTKANCAHAELNGFGRRDSSAGKMLGKTRKGFGERRLTPHSPDWKIDQY